MLFGLLACPPFMALIGHWWPLNILFTLLAGTAVIHGLDRGDRPGMAIALLSFAVGGALVEYHHIWLAMQVAAWHYCRQPTPAALVVWVACVAALVVINGNLWAMAALPLLWLAPHVDLRVPRLRWLFYAMYPAHLALLWWWKTQQ
jgi:hypothetical protein